MELRQFCVIKFNVPPHRDIKTDELVCVDQSWIRCHLKKENKLAVSYPDEEKEMVRRRVRNGEKFSSTWKLYAAEHVQSIDTYEEAEKIIRSLQPENYASEKEAPENAQSSGNINENMIIEESKGHPVTKALNVFIDTLSKSQQDPLKLIIRRRPSKDSCNQLFDVENAPLSSTSNEEFVSANKIIAGNRHSRSIMQSRQESPSQKASFETSQLSKLLVSTPDMRTYQRAAISHNYNPEDRTKTDNNETRKDVGAEYLRNTSTPIANTTNSTPKDATEPLREVLEDVCKRVGQIETLFKEKNEYFSKICKTNMEIAAAFVELNKTITNISEHGIKVNINTNATTSSDDVDMEDDTDTVKKRQGRTRKPVADKTKVRDTKWTLKYQQPIAGLVELIPKTEVYVNKNRLDYCLQAATDARSLTRLLLQEVYSERALKTCNLSGKMPKNVNLARGEHRPGLDQHARYVLTTFVKEHGKSAEWQEVDNQILNNTIRSKIQEIRNREAHNDARKLERLQGNRAR